MLPGMSIGPIWTGWNRPGPKALRDWPTLTKPPNTSRHLLVFITRPWKTTKEEQNHNETGAAIDRGGHGHAGRARRYMHYSWRRTQRSAVSDLQLRVSRLKGGRRAFFRGTAGQRILPLQQSHSTGV